MERSEKRVLVTGGAGFIGSNFVMESLHARDWKMVVLDKLTYAGNLATLEPLINEGVEFIQGDITNRGDVRRAMKGVDYVAHFAAESHVDRSRFDPTGFHKTNVEGTHILLEEAQRAGVARFHHVSTDEVFGALPLDSDYRFNEHTPYNPNLNNPYAVSKADADRLVTEFYKATDMHVTISNCSNNFGPFHFPEKFIPLAITNLIDGLKVPVYGDGLYVRDWIYVKDHARAVADILERGRAGEVYMVGAENEFSNLDITRMILKIMGKGEEDILHVPDRPSHDRRYAIDPSKIMEELGWQPIVTKDKFEWILDKIVKWYQANQDWWRPLLERRGEITDDQGRVKGYIGINREMGGVKFTPI